MTSNYLELMAVLPIDCLNEIQISLLDSSTDTPSVQCRREIQASLGIMSEPQNTDIIGITTCI